ncbi:Crp/Fnr family transcriptional regulator [Lignipirellula cremea]|uniref:HTH-type transcriptional regulator Cmr n=1 Tax=Lignipirellula cremea TaxID=2528010 RepID=A0A518E460_9BACT|nr:Crp/Fnr family transcriptional regulator [Lignipirellula cremea]QDU98871.1 HTH-type transcriptional regulator Cmr [Lignipirellula cremea]
MSATDLLTVLRKLRFLDQLGEEHLQQLAGIAREVSFAQGDVIFREGDPAQDLYLLTHGLVSLEICSAGVGCRRILSLAPGELLGWSPVLEGGQMTATARAVEPTSAIALDGKALLAICAEHPHFGYEFMRRAAMALAKRLRATRMQMLDIYGPVTHIPENSD